MGRKHQKIQMIYFFRISLLIILSSLSVEGFACESRSYKIAIEGIPGGGKTSALIKLITKLSDQNFLLISETNPEPNADWQNDSALQQGDIYHSMWHERMLLVKKLEDRTHKNILFDRSFYSNLAYKYAMDKVYKTNMYSDYVEKYKKDLKYHEFDLIIVLDTSPEIGLNRRITSGEVVPAPWNNLDFLYALKGFYDQELTKLTQDKVVYITTDNIDMDKIQQTIASLATNHSCPADSLDKLESSYPGKENAILLLEEFARKSNLGTLRSELIYIHGIPTIYYSKHSIQLVDGKAVFFNNKQLKDIINSL